MKTFVFMKNDTTKNSLSPISFSPPRGSAPYIHSPSRRKQKAFMSGCVHRPRGPRRSTLRAFWCSQVSPSVWKTRRFCDRAPGSGHLLAKFQFQNREIYHKRGAKRTSGIRESQGKEHPQIREDLGEISFISVPYPLVFVRVCIFLFTHFTYRRLVCRVYIVVTSSSDYFFVGLRHVCLVYLFIYLFSRPT